jgi:hypothetical protein
VKTAHPTEFDPRSMTHPNVQMLLARARTDGFLRQAAKARLVSEARADIAEYSRQLNPRPRSASLESADARRLVNEGT